MNDISIVNQLTQKDQERLRNYKDLLDFYQGKQWVGRERWGEKRLTFNYARVVVDKITSYLMSGINFTVESTRDNPEARARAGQVEKALARVYEYNHLEQLDFETEIDCAVLGDACYKVVWDGTAKEVRITAPDIQGVYVWWWGDDVSRIWRVASRYTLSAEEIELLYRVKPGNKSCNLVEIWTDNDFELYLDGSLLDKKTNPYGFIPFIIFQNLREPKKFWGTSDLVQIMEPQRELNRAFSQVSHILELSGNPVAVLENVEESNDIAVKPGAVWNIPEDAKAYLLDLLQGGGLQLHINYIDQLYRALYDLAESPRAAFGGTNINLSGTAMQIELYPLIQKVLRKRTIRSSVYKKRNQMILKLLGKFSGEVSGDFQPGVVWGPVLPTDRLQLVSNEASLVQNGIHSRRRAMDEVGVKDPEAEFAHWLEEQEQITKIQNTNNKNPSP
jgi:hypothetical protein